MFQQILQKLDLATEQVVAPVVSTPCPTDQARRGGRRGPASSFSDVAGSTARLGMRARARSAADPVPGPGAGTNERPISVA